jgi:hypothetical protein
MTLADLGAYSWRRLINANAKPIEYTPHGAAKAVTVKAFMRAPSAEELAGAAMQTDVIAVIDAAAFARAFPARPRPTKFDRIKTLGPIGMTYTVEVWHPAPAYGGEPVMFTLTLKGGEQ